MRSWIYNVCDHEQAYREVGSQAISYTAGVPATAAALLIADGAWDNRKMNNIEQLAPRPWLQLLETMGLLSRIPRCASATARCSAHAGSCWKAA